MIEGRKQPFDTRLGRGRVAGVLGGGRACQPGRTRGWPGRGREGMGSGKKDCGNHTM